MKLDLEKLRALPPHARSQVAFWSAIAVAGSIGLVWVTTLSMRFNENPVVIEEPREEVVVEEKKSGRTWGEFVSAMQAHAASVVDAFQSVKIEIQEDAKGEPVEPLSQEPEQTPASPAPEDESPHVILIATTTVKNAE